ncbi:MAG: hypothetical protein WD225_10485, partial [Ilumatobacteraceae bacterium]
MAEFVGATAGGLDLHDVLDVGQRPPVPLTQRLGQHALDPWVVTGLQGRLALGDGVGDSIEIGRDTQLVALGGGHHDLVAEGLTEPTDLVQQGRLRGARRILAPRRFGEHPDGDGPRPDGREPGQQAPLDRRRLVVAARRGSLAQIDGARPQDVDLGRHRARDRL